MAPELLSHPLTLLLIGALITSFLAPRLSRGWQDASLALQLKVSLIEDICKTSETYFSRLQLIQNQGEHATISLDNALADWRTDHATIEAKLDIYFPSSKDIHRDWGRLGAALWTTYFLLANQTSKARRSIFEQNIGIFPDQLDRFGTLIDVSIMNVGDRRAEYDIELQALLDTFRFQRLALLNMMQREPLRVRPVSNSRSGALVARWWQRIVKP